MSDLEETFDLDQLRLDVQAGLRKLRITTHAQTEAFKDGLRLSDLRHVFETGEIIEFYPDEFRALLYADTVVDSTPVHIVVEDTPHAGVIITAYVPVSTESSAHGANARITRLPPLRFGLTGDCTRPVARAGDSRNRRRWVANKRRRKNHR